MRSRRSWASALVLSTTFSCASASSTSPTSASTVSSGVPTFAVLVFSRTEGFRHDSIPAGIAAIQQQGRQLSFSVDAGENPGAFTDESLARYKAVVFLSTTGDVLNGAQQASFERFIHNGGGFVGVHSAADTEYEWPFYGALMGAYFAGHPDIQSAAIQMRMRDIRRLPGCRGFGRVATSGTTFREIPGET